MSVVLCDKVRRKFEKKRGVGGEGGFVLVDVAPGELQRDCWASKPQVYVQLAWPIELQGSMSARTVLVPLMPLEWGCID